MGIKVPTSIADYGRFDIDVGVRCLACRRLAVFEPAEVIAFFAARGVPMTVPVTTLPFKCRCGSKDLQTIAVQKCCRPEPLPAKRPILQPLYVQEPRG